ncbi:hypothetical protein DMC14_003200 [Metamycoplasma phocicerebrale]|uniref:Uncharacterized protein n=1 Tax=Metamycoplasma phocicerebrale TaxID=142649 RepID=A0A3Q9VBX2_9BACT|nr:hypothetical protein [Metamycoplasma phocicerebrale]AZZ65770.1 hypothetical protein DMC14_003200 [Metamycoplasma phocicerebrale]
MDNKNTSFKITINFLNDKKIIIRNGELYINIDEEDDWLLINSNSIMAYDNTIIKIKDLDENKEFYLFLINTNLIVSDNVVTINTFNKENIYKKATKRINNKEEIKDLVNKINYYNSLQKIGLSLDQYIEKNSLNQKLYIETLKQNLQLIGDRNYEDKK